MKEPKLQTNTMDSKHKKMRMNAPTDRLSSLPDELIHKIMSFINIREAIETSVLSSRWRFVWISMPHLNFSSEGFSTLPKFFKFLRRVLSRIKTHNNLTEVYAVKLNFHGNESRFDKRILDYVLSHSIQQLDVVCLLKNDIKFPLSLFSSQSLKHLSLTMRTGYSVNGCLNSTLELPALTTLSLHYVTFCDKCIGVFSKCVNLKNLTLNEFGIKGSKGLSISHPQLSNLTLKYSGSDVNFVNVAAPQLKNLTIRSNYVFFVISAPELTSLIYKGTYPRQLSTEGFPSLEKANICFQYQLSSAYAQEIVCLLQQLRSVKFLSLNLETVELLSSSAGLLLPQPSPFVNLKMLNIYPEFVQYLWENAPKKVAMSTELRSYLLDGSPGATLNMVLCEEIIAQKQMAELGVLLKKEKNTTKSMAQTKSCREKLGMQIEMARLLNSKLQSIEEVLIKLPASHRAKLQPRFSSLSAEADIAISKIIDYMMIPCDENRHCSRSQVFCLRNLEW